MHVRFPLKSFLAALTALLLYATPFSVRAQDYKFSRLNVEQGLSQAVINCILQDQRGFMWFGTQEGLNRYDGYNFQVFKRSPDDSNSISNNFIYTLCEDKNGIIWIGTNGGGMDSYNPATEKFAHYTSDEKNPNTLSNDIVRIIHQSIDGKLWVGTNNGLNEFDPATGKVTRFMNNPNDPYSISSNNIYAIEEDGAGNVWVGTYGKGISMYDKSSRRFFNYPISNEDIRRLYPASIYSDSKRQTQAMEVRCMISVDDSHFWIATNSGGIQVFNTLTHAYESTIIPQEGKTNTISAYKILSLCDDKKGNIWIGSFDSGIDIYNKKDKTFEHYLPTERDNYALTSAGIKSMLLDRSGNMWIGTSGKGINVYFKSTSTIALIRHSERPGVNGNTIKSSQILSVMEDHNGTTWIGSADSGLTSLDRRTGIYKHHPELSTAINNGILSLLEGSDSTIWIGTYGEGLNHYYPETGKISYYTPFNQLGDGTILCIAEEPSTHKIWFGTFGSGVYCLDPKTDSLQQFTSETDQLSSNYIYSIYFDKKGALWIGTRAGGAMRRDKNGGKFVSYVHDDKNKKSLSNNIVYCIAEDHTGNVWLTTANGLNRFDEMNQSFDIWYEKDGLPSDNIYAVLFDLSGNLWMSHNKGITRFSPGKTGADAFRNFGFAAGVQSSEFNQGAYFRNKKGELFFGGQGGLNIIDPKKTENISASPPVYIISYKRFGKEVHLDSAIYAKKEIDVSWRDNNFMFELVALDYVDPQKNMFQYKLEGIDDDWSPVTSNRYISYTNLPGGHYSLHIRAADSNGNWSEDKVLVNIFVKPPFWRTNWFYSICVIVIVGGIIGFIRYRTGAIKKENRILEAKVAERTQELAQKNADITASIQYARRIQSAMLPELDVIFQSLPESFVLYRPKDIVSGDFYWFAEKNGRSIIAVGDCTGHGVPGALMSMIGHNLLNEIVLEKGITDPDEILNRLNTGVRTALKQDLHDQDTADGMDIALCSIDKSKREVNFSGALRPLIVIRKGVMNKLESDRFPIGGSQDTRERKFTRHQLILDPGDTIYMFSDGYADQFGGEKGKKFMMKQLLHSLLKNSDKSMPEQSASLESNFDDWKKGYQQVDDVLVVGIRL